MLDSYDGYTKKTRDELDGKATMIVPVSACIDVLQGLSDDAILVVVSDLLACVRNEDKYNKWVEDRL